MRRRMADAGKSFAALVSTWLNKISGNRAKDAFGILVYHRIAEIPSEVTKPTWNVTPTSFRRQMEGLLSRGYQVWPLRQVVEHCVNNKSMPEKMTVLTFDDGYQNVYLNAWPILRELRIPATIFVATAYLDSTEPFPCDDWGLAYHEKAPPEIWRPMTWSQCQELDGSDLIEIGSHSHTHQDFRCRDAEFKRDLEISLRTLQENLGERLYAFSFPFGSAQLGFATDAFIEAAKEAPLICALTTEIGLVRPGDSPFHWGRFEVTNSDTANSIVAKLEGWYNWMSFARKIFRVVSPPELVRDKK